MLQCLIPNSYTEQKFPSELDSILIIQIVSPQEGC